MCRAKCFRAASSNCLVILDPRKLGEQRLTPLAEPHTCLFLLVRRFTEKKPEAWNHLPFCLWMLTCECWWSQLWCLTCCFLDAVLYRNTAWWIATTFTLLIWTKVNELWMSVKSPYRKAAIAKVLVLHVFLVGAKLLPSVLLRNELFKLNNNLILLFLPPICTIKQSVRWQMLAYALFTLFPYQ